MTKTPGYQPNRIFSNREKAQIAEKILERYTGSTVKQFEKRILLTNFDYFPPQFEKLTNSMTTTGTAMKASHSKKYGVSLVNFNIGSPTAALIIEVLATVHPEAGPLLGLCGGLPPPP